MENESPFDIESRGSLRDDVEIQDQKMTLQFVIVDEQGKIPEEPEEDDGQEFIYNFVLYFLLFFVIALVGCELCCTDEKVKSEANKLMELEEAKKLLEFEEANKLLEERMDTLILENTFEYPIDTEVEAQFNWDFNGTKHPVRMRCEEGLFMVYSRNYRPTSLMLASVDVDFVEFGKYMSNGEYDQEYNMSNMKSEFKNSGMIHFFGVWYVNPENQSDIEYIPGVRAGYMHVVEADREALFDNILVIIENEKQKLLQQQNQLSQTVGQKVQGETLINETVGQEVQGETSTNNKTDRFLNTSEKKERKQAPTKKSYPALQSDTLFKKKNLSDELNKAVNIKTKKKRPTSFWRWLKDGMKAEKKVWVLFWFLFWIGFAAFICLMIYFNHNSIYNTIQQTINIYGYIASAALISFLFCLFILGIIYYNAEAE